MTLTPQHMAKTLDFDDVACLMAGLDPAEVEWGFLPGEDLVQIPRWKKVMAEAILDGSLEVDEGFLMVFTNNETRFWPQDPSSLDLYDPHQHDLVARFRREHVYHWLRSRNTEDAAIPEALRIMPKHKAPASPQDKPLHPRRRQTYLTLIEALALETLDGEIPAEPYKVAARLQTILELYGLKLDKDPVADTVKEILAAREERKSERP